MTTKPDDTTQTEVHTDYAYDTLTSSYSKDLYIKIGQNITNAYAPTITVDGELDDYLIAQAVEAYKNDHPENFWLKGVDNYTNYDSYTKIALTYTRENDDLLEAKSKFDAAVDAALQNAPLRGAFAKEEYANNYIVDKCTYDSNAANSSSVDGDENDAYGALVQGSAVCEGYARAFQLLCNRLDIDCVMISGKVKTGNHAWNCVKIGGNWYQIDVTWNDTDGKNEYAQNDYFNLTDSVMYTDHTLSPKYSDITTDEYMNLDVWCNFFVPKCASDDYSYYGYKYPTLSQLDNADEICTAIAAAAKNREKYFSIVIDSNTEFDYMYDEIVQDGYLSDWLSKANDINSSSPCLNVACYVYRKDRLSAVTMALEYVN